MPIHEYACRDCGHAFEKLVRSSDAPGSLQCPHCHSAQLDKQLSVFATASSDSGASAAMAQEAFCGAPCGSCGHPDGPGACGLPN